MKGGTDARRIQKLVQIQTTGLNLLEVERNDSNCTHNCKRGRKWNKLIVNNKSGSQPNSTGTNKETNKIRAIRSIKGSYLFQEHRRILEFDKRPHSVVRLRMWGHKNFLRMFLRLCFSAETLRFSHGDWEEMRLPLLCTWRAPWSLWLTKQNPSSPNQMSPRSHYLSIIFTLTKMPLYLTKKQHPFSSFKKSPTHLPRHNSTRINLYYLLWNLRFYFHNHV